MFSERFEQLVQALRILPSVGPKSAQRMALHLLMKNREGAFALSYALHEASSHIHESRICHSLTENEICDICASTERDSNLLCVVESPADVMAIEQSGSFRGKYHVLGGHLSPLDGIGPEQLSIESLVQRIEKEKTEELVFALNPNIQGDTTIYFIQKKIAHLKCKVTTIARGIAFGGELEYADEMTLARSIANRLPVQQYVQ